MWICKEIVNIMKKKLLSILAAAVLLTLALCPCALAETPQDVMTLLEAKDFEGLYAVCSDALQQAVGGAEGFQLAWAQIEGMLGAYQGVLALDEAAGTVTCDFANATATLGVAMDAQGKLSAFTVTGYEWKKTEETGAWTEEPIMLRKGEVDETNGLLTLPEGEGPFPCAILMQGSGASDMDETSYGFAVFAKLAHALAERGVATLRYDKYPYAHPELCRGADFTVDQEYTADARAALELAEADARIGNIYLLGHSEGALVAPRVAAELGTLRLSGLVLIAGSPLPMWQILLRQLEDQQYEGVEEMRAAFEGMPGMTEDELRAETVLGTPLYYWQDQGAYDYAGQIVESGIFTYVAQGGKDFQVLPSEGVEAWQAALGDYAGLTCATYPNMTHLLFDLEGVSTGTMSDYANAVDLTPALADDLAQWMK